MTAPSGAPARAAQRARIGDLAATLALAILAVAGFASAYSGLGFALAGIGGAVLGTVVAVWAARAAWGPLRTLLLAIAVYVLAGSALAMPAQATAAVLPNLLTLRGLALGSVFGWGDLLTLAAPVSAPDYIAVVPYLAGFAVQLIAVTLLLRWLPRRPQNPRRLLVVMIPAAVLALGTLVLGTADPVLPVLRAVAAGVIVVLWLAARRYSGPNRSLSVSSDGRRRLILGATAVLAGGAVLGGAATVGLGALDERRVVVRDVVQPPFDPRDYPSPLAGFREYTKTAAERELFRVSGLRSEDRLRLATLNTYDGILWNVAGPELEDRGAGAFRLTGERWPARDVPAGSTERTVAIEMLGYTGIWLPLVGEPRSLALPAEPVEAARDLRVNPVTTTAVLTSGVPEGLRYTMVSAVPGVPSEDSLADVPVAGAAAPPVDRVPNIIAAKAKEYAGTGQSPIEQLRSMERTLSQNGYLSHGLASDTASSRAGHGADRLEELFTRTQLIGDEEQYAAAFALMARELGYPARVVMGFAPENIQDSGESVVRGADVTAWVEVPFEGVGWVSFFPTPDDTEIPQDQNPKPKSEPQPQVRQPPRADEPADDLLTDVSIDDKDDSEKEDDSALPAWLWVVLAALLVLAGVWWAPVLIKTRRMRRRRDDPAADRAAAGAWDEFLDRRAEAGHPVRPGQTRRVTAQEIDAQAAATVAAGDSASDAPRLLALADRVDELVFSGRTIERAESEQLWTDMLDLLDAQGQRVGWQSRLRARMRIARWRAGAPHRSVSKREKVAGGGAHGGGQETATPNRDAAGHRRSGPGDDGRSAEHAASPR